MLIRQWKARICQVLSAKWYISVYALILKNIVFYCIYSKPSVKIKLELFVNKIFILTISCAVVTCKKRRQYNALNINVNLSIDYIQTNLEICFSIISTRLKLPQCPIYFKLHFLCTTVSEIISGITQKYIHFFLSAVISWNMWTLFGNESDSCK